MAFTRKTYTGPVKNRGAVARGGKKLADVSKEELDAFRKKAGNEDLSYKEALRKLLNADRNAKPASRSMDGIKAAPKAADKPKSSDLDRELNREGARQVQKSQENYMKKLPDNRPTAFDDKGVMKRKSPEMVKMPDTRADRTKAPEMIKADNKDDTSLSVSERIKRAKDRARTSDTGTDTRSVSERIKSAFKSAGDAVSPTAGMARRAREAAEKEMGKGMKRGGTVRGDGIAKRGKTKGRMC